MSEKECKICRDKIKILELHDKVGMLFITIEPDEASKEIEGARRRLATAWHILDKQNCTCDNKKTKKGEDCNG